MEFAKDECQGDKPFTSGKRKLKENVNKESFITIKDKERFVFVVNIYLSLA